MTVYVETNFVLELAFQQEQAAGCEEILDLAESASITLALPAYALAEPHEKLHRQASERADLQRQLDGVLKQLKRTPDYEARLAHISNIAALLTQSNEEETRRFESYRRRLLSCVDVIPLTGGILAAAATAESDLDLSPQDAIVYASVRAHLMETSPASACFLNKNSKDFDTAEIIADLKAHNCRMIRRFDDGLAFIRSQI